MTMQLTQDQQQIVNLCIRLQGLMQESSVTEGEKKSVEPTMQLLSNGLIDLNRIANALDVISTASVVKAGDVAAKSITDEALVMEFAMWLTTRDKSFVVGAGEVVYPMNDALQEYAKIKGWKRD